MHPIWPVLSPGLHGAGRSKVSICCSLQAACVVLHALSCKLMFLLNPRSGMLPSVRCSSCPTRNMPLLVPQSLFRKRGAHLLDSPVMGRAKGNSFPKASESYRCTKLPGNMAGDGLGTGPEGAAPDELVLKDICDNSVEGRVSAEVCPNTSFKYAYSNIDPGLCVSYCPAPVLEFSCST